MQESQIATHDQTKVESESKYPVKITGLLLLNGFVNTGAVDMAATPTVALPGAGSTGAPCGRRCSGSMRAGRICSALAVTPICAWISTAVRRPTVRLQTIPATTTPTRRCCGSALLTLRCNGGTRKPIFRWIVRSSVPISPTSLTAVAVPALAWSGNLWTWNPQLGVTQDFGPPIRAIPAAGCVDRCRAMRRYRRVISTLGLCRRSPPSGAEQSRWPGVEARVALLGTRSESDEAAVISASADISLLIVARWVTASIPGRGHSMPGLLLPAHLEFTGSFYRGLALGGLGGGAYKDFAYTC